MEYLQIYMLGRFDLIIHDRSVIKFLGNLTKGGQLLKYLILNNRIVPVSELIDLFWSNDEESANPETALRTMVSRLRTGLAKGAPELKNCIRSENRGYIWSPMVPCQVDVFQFETQCTELLSVGEFDDNIRQQFWNTIYLYGGDLASPGIQEGWMMSRSMHLHDLYLQLVYRFVEILNQHGEWESLIHLCRTALEVDSFDETLNLALMTALKENGQSGAALAQYQNITAYYSKYLGIGPSDVIHDFYRQLIRADLAAEADLNVIRQSLRSGRDTEGAFVCDFSIFKDICQLQLRNIERQSNEMYMALISVHPETDIQFEPLMLDNIMQNLQETLVQCLRKGDTVARYSSSQFAVLLPMRSYQFGQTVLQRIKKNFHQNHPNIPARLHFQFGAIDE